MSSAILYLGIVAIWACVLIPRWLRRDSARGLPAAHGTAAAGDETTGDAVSGKDAGAGIVPGDSAQAAVVPERPRVMAEPDVPHETDAHREEADADAVPPGQNEAPPPLTREQARHRTLVARRRLLGMLVVLEGAALALAVSGLAALWVVIPPSLMLAGYLLLLREAAHADAEQARRELEAARTRARARERARARAARHTGAPLGAPVGTATVSTPAASAADYEDAGPGRDFAPGLAGKYTTSNAEVIHISERADEDFYDQQTQHKLRAVGD